MEGFDLDQIKPDSPKAKPAAVPLKEPVVPSIGGEISFGSNRPKFHSKFANASALDQASFPEIGGEVKKSAEAKKTSSGCPTFSSSGSGGAPKFHSKMAGNSKNRFGEFKKEEEPEKTEAEPQKTESKPGI